MAESPYYGVKVVYPALREMRRSEIYYVYILKSKSFNRYYTEHTNRLERRLIEHNAGKTRSTKTYTPWEIVYFEKHQTKFDAYSREMEIKSYKSGFKFKELLKLERWQSG